MATKTVDKEMKGMKAGRGATLRPRDHNATHEDFRKANHDADVRALPGCLRRRRQSLGATPRRSLVSAELRVPPVAREQRPSATWARRAALEPVVHALGMKEMPAGEPPDDLLPRKLAEADAAVITLLIMALAPLFLPLRHRGRLVFAPQSFGIAMRLCLCFTAACGS
jgi:hypothetical protein